LAWDYFYEVEGTPYGYKNLVFSMIDTPYDNFNAPMSSDILPNMLRYIDLIWEKSFEKYFADGLGFRMGFYDEELTTFEQIMTHAYADLEIDIASLMTIPENDAWEYTGGLELTSSSFVMNVLRAASVLPGA
jgi:hypothetical protein